MAKLAQNPHTHKIYMHHVYLLKSKQDGHLYIGCTKDLGRRISEHNGGLVRSTKSRGPFDLVYYESYKSERDAFHREKNLKLQANALTGLKRRLSDSLSEIL